MEAYAETACGSTIRGASKATKSFIEQVCVEDISNKNIKIIPVTKSVALFGVVVATPDRFWLDVLS